MIRTVIRLSPSFVLPIFRERNENDYDVLNRPLPGGPQTGWDRVKAMYKKNEFDEVSPELHTVVQSTLCGAFVGVCFGGFVSSREAYLYFIENNQATAYKTVGDAKKKLQDYVTIGFAKGAYKWGWKLSIFTGMFSLIATTISAYRGDTTLIEYTTAGALTGALYKANLGLAAMIVGGSLGAVLSTIGGLLIIGILKITGVRMSDIRQALYKIKESRTDHYNQAIEKSSKIKHDDLTRHHDTIVQEQGEVKIEEV